MHPYAIGVLLISLVLAHLAVARVTRVLVEDRIAVRLRQWVVRKWGEAGKMAYLFHCPWCMSLWVSLLIMPPAALWPDPDNPLNWFIAVLAVPAGSMVAGLLLDTFVREEK